MTSKIERLKQERERLIHESANEQKRIIQIEKEITCIEREKRTRRSESLLRRIRYPDAQSRVYVADKYPLGELRTYSNYKSIKYVPLTFPTETIEESRRLVLQRVPLRRFNRIFVDLIKRPELKKETRTLPKLHFQGIFSLKYYEIAYLESLFGIRGTIRIGQAITYTLKHIPVYQTVHISGYTDGCYGEEWWVEGHDERVPYSSSSVYKARLKKTPMAILSARTSSDLDTLEKKLGLGR